MTCIIGYIDKKDDSVWIGADSLGSNGYTKKIIMQHKVFRSEIYNELIIGSTGTFRHIDLLKYSDKLFDEIDIFKNTELNHKYMVNKFIPKVIELFREGFITDQNKEKGANFIIGIKDKLFEVQEDYSVLDHKLGFCAVGSGEEVAIGSLLTSKDMKLSVPQKIEKALISAEEYCCGVQRPFVIINTKTKEEIIIE